MTKTRENIAAPRRILLLATGLLLGSWFSVQAAEPFAVIQSVQGKVEIRKAGHHQWTFAAANLRLGNNDMLRTYARANAVLQYPDGSKIMVKENTQILLNLSSHKSRRSISKYITAFFGAIYFMVREAVPKPYVHRVYTPTAVVTIRGTKLAVSVNPTNGKTDVAVTHGKVLVRNILLNRENFVEAGQKTTVELNRMPTSPKRITPNDLEGMKTWIGKAEWKNLRRMMKSLKKTASSRGSGAPGHVVLRLSPNPGSHVRPTLLQELREKLIATLQKTSIGKIIPTEDSEKDLDDLGVQFGAQWVIGGEIDALRVERIAAITSEADEYREYAKAEARMTFLVVDPENGLVARRIPVDESIYQPFASDDPQDNALKGLTAQIIEKVVAELSTEAHPYLTRAE